MSDKLSLKKRKIIRTLAAALAVVLLLSLPACSEPQTPAATPTRTPLRTFAQPTPTPVPTPSPTPEPTPGVSSTPRPTPVVSFPPFKVDASGDYIFPQVVADRTEAMTKEFVNFKIVTSDKVNSIRTIIDGEEQSTVYKNYTTDKGMRIWQTRVSFTKGGNRRVQFKCAMASGGTAKIPENPIKIAVTFNYTAESTSKTISKGKTVTFTLKTPDTIDSIFVVVDGVNQKIEYDKPDSTANGISIWKINVTFSKTGTRAVTFEALDGTKVKATFPDPGITIIVQ